MAQIPVPAVVMRGGTSRGVFFKDEDLPVDPVVRSAMFVEVMGSPDPLQVDGLGGTTSGTSKVMVVGRSDRSDCDVAYSLGQVAVSAPDVHYRSNCGSLAAAVAVFAVDEGLVDVVTEPHTIVRMVDRNTGVRLHARVPVRGGRPVLEGDWAIPGIGRPGAPIVTTYLEPGGAILGKVLPTGGVCDDITVPGIGTVTVSIVDVTCATVFVDGADIGVTARDDPSAVNADPAALARVETLRAACAVRLGMARDTDDATRTTPQQPKVTVCARPDDERGDGGASLDVRTFSMGRMHAAFPVTGLLCTAAAAAIPGTIPHRLRTDQGASTARLRHARGVIPVDVDLTASPHSQPDVRTVSIVQTARRIMRGEILVSAAA